MRSVFERRRLLWAVGLLAAALGIAIAVWSGAGQELWVRRDSSGARWVRTVYAAPDLGSELPDLYVFNQECASTETTVHVHSNGRPAVGVHVILQWFGLSRSSCREYDAECAPPTPDSDDRLAWCRLVPVDSARTGR